MSMIVFSYRGVDGQGAPASGTVEAADKDDALRQLRLLETQGLHDLSIEGVQKLNGNPQTSRRFCGSCGAENPAANRFCAGCGKPLGEAVQVKSAAAKQGRKQVGLPLWQRLACLGCLALVGWLMSIALTPPGRPPTAPAAKAGRYTIATIKDASLKAVKSLGSVPVAELRRMPMNVRKAVRIVVDPGLSQAQYAATIEQAIRDLTAKDRDIDEIMVFVYDDASDVDGGFTVARAEWAPNGKWGAGAVTPAIASSNNRRSYRVNIEWRKR